MAQTSHLKSAQLTALDTVTPSLADVQNAGNGAPARTVTVSGSSATVSADNTASTYQLVRVPSNAVIKYVGFSAQAMSAGKLSISVYYSSSTIDGTAPANQGLVVSGCVALFSSDIDCSSAVVPTEELTEANSFTPLMRQQPLWQAAGLASDPGGKFDIVATCHTTGITTGARLNVRAYFVE